MKNTAKQKAREMYFQTGMSKTAIADSVGVNRRTVLLWCKQEEWNRLRQASRTMPSIIAEKIYYLLDNYLNQCLRTPDCTFADYKDAQTIYLLTSAIKKLKNRSTVNEMMETFNSFLEGLKKRKPELATQIQPEMEEFVAVRGEERVEDHYMKGVNEFGGMGFPPDEVNAEEWQDKKDLDAFEEELKRTGNYEQALENWQKQQPSKNQPPDTTTSPSTN